MTRFSYLILVLALAALMILPACAKKEMTPIEDIEPAEDIAPPPPPPPVLEEVEEEPVVEVEPIVLEDIFFDYDKFSIKPEYKDILTMNAEILMDNPEVNLLVEGHCDERGTNEYNLSLGEKRAKAILDFYVAYGVSARRLSLVSYGEEKPFNRGHDENAWSMNRRAHMVLK
ncbi:MAG: peptidoglycan-associated lipoprotein Pal [Candidatus Krumholzibacteriota bacterium]|nr:peptidoglycan-associated lipoprotein Pal [Candidatus Krumholzibacteriota bacterium]